MDLKKLIYSEPNIKSIIRNNDIEYIKDNINFILKNDQDLFKNPEYRLKLLTLLSALLTYLEAKKIINSKGNRPSPSTPDEDFLDDDSYSNLRKLYELTNQALS